MPMSIPPISVDLFFSFFRRKFPKYVAQGLKIRHVPTMAGNFRYTVWDPWMILAQMATLQCWYYVSLGLWLFILEALTGYPRNLDHIFKYSSLFVSLSHGKVVVAAFIFNALSR